MGNIPRLFRSEDALDEVRLDRQRGLTSLRPSLESGGHAWPTGPRAPVSPLISVPQVRLRSIGSPGVDGIAPLTGKRWPRMVQRPNQEDTMSDYERYEDLPSFRADQQTTYGIPFGEPRQAR